MDPNWLLSTLAQSAAAIVAIVFAGAVVLYHCVVTSLDPPPYEMTAVTVHPPLEHALPTTVAEGSAPGTCVYCVPVVIVR